MTAVVAVREASVVVTTPCAPLGCSSSSDVWASTPVNALVPIAVTRDGVPSSIEQNDTG